MTLSPRPALLVAATALVACATLAYAQAGPGLEAALREQVTAGRDEFKQRWVVFLGIGGKWGRGPTSNGEACSDCHANNGRGHAPDSSQENLASMVVRLSVPGEDDHGGPLPHPRYGDQLQNQGELGRVPAEGSAAIAWEDHDEHLEDGTRVTLRKPNLRLHSLAFGDIGPDTLTSIRIAPPVFGAGLLDAVTPETLQDIARAQRQLGFNGRLNYVWDAEGQATVPGRFGWKANQPNLRQQVASAFLNELGVTTGLFKIENCPAIQTACRKRPLGMVPEQPGPAFDALLVYLRALGVPARHRIDDPVAPHGEKLFAQAQCSVCHVPEMKTGDFPALAQLSDQTIHPYSDLLLHDMGEGLADGRPDFLAGPRDWRTPPLWGVGLSGKVNGNVALLHDGRARDLTEAILWHGGEAAASREAFVQMPKAEREALIVFLNSL
ncbi:MAG: di-heme oxidoredictase family protein [Betaproteobacteria bacterium]|jgi:CxxC motif-containing protein (DUF1111 family)